MRIHKIMMATLSLALCCSCSDLLEKKPLVNLTVENYYTTEGEAKTALMGIYHVFMTENFGLSSRRQSVRRLSARQLPLRWCSMGRKCQIIDPVQYFADEFILRQQHLEPGFPSRDKCKLPDRKCNQEQHP